MRKILTRLRGLLHVGRFEKCVSGRDERKCGVVYPFNAIVERAVSDFGGIRMLERACADERSRDFGEMSANTICTESRRLIAAAKKNGCFLELKDIPGTKYTIRTGESEVRLMQQDRVYYKIKNPFAKSHLKKHSPKYALAEHVIHNILFPESRLEFLGITEDMHEARLVYRQNAVKTDERPTDAEIASQLADIGLFSVERYCFGNDLVFVTDVGQDSDNVLRGLDGVLYFIDPIIGFRNKLCIAIDDALRNDLYIQQLVADLRM